MQVLMDHNWPGNVRELENAIERAVVLATEETVPVERPAGSRSPCERHPHPPRRGRIAAAADASLFEVVADFERRKIMDSLEACNYSQTEAAEALRIPLSTLNQKIKRLEIPIKKKAAGEKR